MRCELTYATVCSGIECCSVACRGLPLRPVFFSEIEPFPCAVLKAHYHDVPNLGDMSKIQVSNDGKEITNGTTTIRLHERLGILAGGTPCQDVSVAGKRAGMQEGSGTRSSLAFDFVRLARELRPRWVLWENVAGSIDSKNAPDFLRFASALGDCGYSLAWRVLDAQYVRVDGMERAVPQRRRRVWVVGCLGADESAPAQILFEPDCAQGHTPPRRRTGQGFAYSLAGRDRVDAGVVGCAPGTGGEGEGCRAFIPYGTRLGASPEGITQPITRIDSKFQQCIALDGDKLKPREALAVRTANTHANGHGVADEATHTIDGANGQGVAYSAQGGEVASTITRQISEQSGQDNRANAVVQLFETSHADEVVRMANDDCAPTVQNREYKGGMSVVQCYENDSLKHSEVCRTLTGNHDDRVTDTGTSVVVSTQGLDGYNQQMTGDVAPTCRAKNADTDHLPLVVSTNSNGEDVAPTISSCEYKMGQKQKDTGGGGYVLTSREEGAHDEPQL